MRTLLEIIDCAKDGQMPTHEECYWAMLALNGLHYFDQSFLFRLGKKERDAGETKLFGACFWEKESIKISQTAFNKSPQDFVGPNDDPSNPEFQSRRKIGLKIFEKLSKSLEEQEK